MKKLVGLLVFTLILSSAVQAQEKRGNWNKGENFTAEQMATLLSKKMTLSLDLNASQQKAVFKMMKKNAEERLKIREERRANKGNRNSLTQEQRFQNANLRLEKQIANKAEIKKILTPEQFDKLKKARNKSMNNNKKGRAGKRSNNKANKNRTCNNKFNKSGKKK